MNVYDFDGTIYKKDSTIEFYLFCLKKRPFLVFCMIRQSFAILLYVANIYSKTKLKEEFFCFLRYIKDVDQLIDEFWKNEYKNIRPWYLAQKATNDIIISASPEFLIIPIAHLLGDIQVIGSKVDKKTGKFDGENCYGIEKVRRFKETIPNINIEKFFSDSISDLPLANIAQEAYLIKTDNIEKWNVISVGDINKQKTILEIIRYGFWGGITTCLNLLVFQMFLLLKINYLLANVVSYFIAVVFSYIFNRAFVFEDSIKVSFFQILKFIIVRIGSIALDSGFLFLAVEILQGDILISKICISCLIILGTYCLNRNYVFKHNN